MKEKIKQNLKISSTFTAALVGAGFASGQEIALFFGGNNIASVILAAALIALFCYVFLELGRLSEGNVFESMGPVFSLCFNYLVKLINLIILAVMTAGSEYIIKNSLGFTGGGAVSLMLCCVLVTEGMESVKTLNMLTVPIMIILISALLFTAGGKIILSGKTAFFNSLAYAGMNIITGGYLVGLMAKDIHKSQCRHISLICFGQVLILLIFVYAAVNLCEAGTMPLLAQAYKYRFGFAGVVTIFLALFTTMVSALASCSQTKTQSVLIYAGLGFLFSLFGFHNLVNATYMPIGGAGFAITACCSFYLICLSLRNRRRPDILPRF